MDIEPKFLSEGMHIAITPDGSRRWADNRQLPRELGHLQGAKLIEPIVEHAARDGARAVTIFSFAEKNRKRSHDEWTKLNGVFRHMLNSDAVDRMFENNVRVAISGDITIFDGDVQERALEIAEISSKNSGIICNFALNYDGRSEIIRAANLALEKRSPELRGEPITTEEITANTYTGALGLQDPELAIRTGAVRRTSSFLTWQTVDTELYFTDTLWPDFTVEEYDIAVEWFHQQKRNFGK